jgi:hypothetical protein
MSILGFALRKEIPLLSAAAVVADGGIIFAFYKVALDTIKAANDLENVGLENQKLRFEIEEKRAAAEKAGAYVVVATLEQIQAYAPPPNLRERRYRSRNWVPGGGAAVLTLFLGLSLSLFYALDRKEHLMNVEQPMHEPTGKELEGSRRETALMEGKLYPKIECGEGTLGVNPFGYISFSSKSAHGTTLRFFLSNKGSTLTIPLSLTESNSSGERIFSGENLDITIPTSGAIIIKDAKGKIVTACRFTEQNNQQLVEWENTAEKIRAEEVAKAQRAEKERERPERPETVP